MNKGKEFLGAVFATKRHKTRWLDRDEPTANQPIGKLMMRIPRQRWCWAGSEVRLRCGRCRHGA